MRYLGVCPSGTSPLALAALASLVLAGSAAADRGVVYIQERLGHDTVLMPLPVRVRTARDFAGRVSLLFARLKKEKPHVYGRAELDLGGSRAKEIAQSRIITVELDPDRPRTRDEVIAEVVYTFTAIGAKGVRAGVRGEPGRVYTRADVSIPAYVLAVPLWLGLPPAPFPDALVRLADGEVVIVAEVEKRLRAGPGAVADAVVALLQDPSVPRRLRAVRALGYLPESMARTRLLDLLRDGDARVRAAAVQGLSAQPASPEVAQALAKLLSDDRDEEVRAAVARALMQSGNPQSAQHGLGYLLKSPDSARKVALLRGLKAEQLAGLVGELIPVLSDPSAEVRRAALQALSGRTEAKLLDAVAGLVERDTDPEVRSAAAQMLVRSGENRFVARGLGYELSGSDEERAISAAQQLGGLGADGRAALEGALEKARPKVREAAAQALQRLGDPAALPALARAAKDGLKDARRAAVAILAKQSPPELAKMLGGSDPWLKRLAVEAAADQVGAPEVEQALVAATKDPDRTVRRNVARALRRARGTGVGPALSKLLDDEDDRVRKAAADSLGAVGDPESRAALLRLAKYGNIKVRRAVFRALGRLRGTPSREMVAQLLDALYDEDAGVREGALNALASANRKDRRIVPVVRLQLKDSAEGVRRAALKTIGALADESVVGNLEDALTDPAVDVRMAAVDALERIGGARAASVLEKHAAAEKDPGVAARAREAAAKAKSN